MSTPQIGSLASVAAAALSTCVLAACGSDASNLAQGATAPPATASRFGAKTATAANRWYPLTPGYQSVRLGKVNVGSRRLTHRRVYTVTDVVKQIAGVRTVAVLDQDFNGGEIAEQALDYLAVDRRGNVWYFGSYTEAYEGGQFVNVNDGWLSGVKGGKAGILMPAHPRTGTPSYIQARVPGDDPDVARVVKTGVSECVPYKCYKNVLVVEEGGSEHKFYAAGVGEIGLGPIGSGGKEEVEELVNLTHLRLRGLAELSAEVLKLDRHARKTVPQVFGPSKPAKRLR
ncbi:MAG: hypothetical protein QOG94_3612 [Solirubrobacteraceae bacterium]|jgi:hypothetical protein|nr:hypothetical protein [Solirubrobacteraceae bacterium]